MRGKQNCQKTFVCFIHGVQKTIKSTESPCLRTTDDLVAFGRSHHELKARVEQKLAKDLSQ